MGSPFPGLPPATAARPAVPGERSTIRVLIVDDSVVVRGFLARWLAGAGFLVAGTAANGRIALDMLAETRPDVVLLDLHMPEMDGFTALPLLLRARPDLAILVVSSLSRSDAAIALQCLRLGALDCLSKPAGETAPSPDEFHDGLVARIDALAAFARRRAAAGEADPPSGAASSGIRPAGRIRSILIGASTGGPRAVTAVLRGLGRQAELLPIFVAQHMPPLFTAAFAEQLAQETGFAAAEGEDGEQVRAGRVYVGPGSHHMGLGLEGGRPAIRLRDATSTPHGRPAVDVLFQDAALVYGRAAVAVMLTGMGHDGTEGARALVRAGAPVLAQDEATSTVWGMPGSVVQAGLASAVLPLRAIPGALDGLIAGHAA